MKKLLLFLLMAVFLAGCASPASLQVDRPEIVSDPPFDFQSDRLLGTNPGLNANVVLEPWTYTSNFSDRTLGAWASYPFWQDIAYDPNFRTNEIIPGDPNVSIVQRVTPYTNVDNYAGAQKRFDKYLVPDSKVKFRYYLKTNEYAEYFKVRFAAGEHGKIDVTLPAPEINKWVWVNVDYDDFVRENPELAGKDRIKIYALAFLTKIPKADPDMPFYLGLDDITFRGARVAAFQFREPQVHKLPEFTPYIPVSHYHAGDHLQLSGEWPVNAERVSVEIVPYTHQDEIVYEGELSGNGDRWQLDPLRLDFPDGLYLGRLTAYNGNTFLSRTEFTIHIAPENIGGKHPRLMFNEEGKREIRERFQEPRFQRVYENMLESAKNQRENIPVESLEYDLDQFPEEDWLPSWSAWGSRIYHTGNALRTNARAYAFHDDQVAGEYVRDVLVRLAGWPDWTHPWQTKRGRFSEHRTGSWSHRVAEAYDLVYDVMTEDERTKVRKAIMKNIVGGAHRTYVYNDNITAATSNWLAMITGGSLMNMAAMFGDGPETENLEPYFTGALMKFYRFINRVTDSEDGGWGEGYGYNSYSFSNMSFSVPSLKNVFNIDVTEPLVGTYKEFIWGGILKDRRWFEYGDSGSNLGPATNWAFLLDMQQEPLLGWYYNYMKQDDPSGDPDRFTQHETELAGRQSYMDVLYDTENVPMQNAFELNPVNVFRGVGTTVFKSGWEPDDMVFNMRTGPFYNHQHHEQGTFWFADRGEIFILGNRPLSETTYYDDPLYQPWYTQAVGASTILIDGNHQSQRTGDDLHYAPGFHDHAFVDHFLDGQEAAFSTGDIGRLYWGKVESLRRNVLFLKPGAVLMLDTADPGGTDRDVTLLYQTERLEDIRAAQDRSTITRGDAMLNILHLAPGHVEVKAVKHPHYLFTLQRQHPLERSGMLTVTARTSHTHNYPLVMGNLFKTTDAGEVPDVTTETGDGYVSGVVSGRSFAFSTKPGHLYSLGPVTTDALALTWSDDHRFVAKATDFRVDGDQILRSDEPVTFELSDDGIRYYRSGSGRLEIASPSSPSSVQLNGQPVQDYTYDRNRRVVLINVPAGEGELIIR